jgi:predicted Zn-dependent protease
MLPTRTDAFRTMLARQPDHAHARFGLATELAKTGAHEEAVEHFARYLDGFDDEGNGWMRYAESLHALGRDDDAKAAIARGIDAAERHGHAGLVADLEAMRDLLD